MLSDFFSNLAEPGKEVKCKVSFKGGTKMA